MSLRMRTIIYKTSRCAFVIRLIVDVTANEMLDTSASTHSRSVMATKGAPFFQIEIEDFRNWRNPTRTIFSTSDLSWRWRNWTKVWPKRISHYFARQIIIFCIQTYQFHGNETKSIRKLSTKNRRFDAVPLTASHKPRGGFSSPTSFVKRMKKKQRQNWTGRDWWWNHTKWIY